MTTLIFFFFSETEQYAKREEVWNQIEELARKKNPQFENLINQMDYLSLSQNNNDFTLNEDDFSSEKIDQYSKDVSRMRLNFLNESLWDEVAQSVADFLMKNSTVI